MEPLTEIETRRYAITPNVFGFLAQLLSIFLVIGIFVFILSDDKPFDEQINKIKEIIKERKLRMIIMLAFLLGVLLLIIFTIIGKIVIGSAGNLLNEYSYRIGILVLYIWILVQPALILSGSFLSLDLFKIDYQNFYQKYQIKGVIFFLIELMFSIMLMVVIFLIFNVTLNFRPDPLDIKPLDLIFESIGFFRINFYWLLLNLHILLIIVSLLVLTLFLTEKLKLLQSTPFSLNQVIFFCCFILLMPGIVIFFSLPSTIAFSQVIIPINYVILAFFLLCIVYLIFINTKRINENYLKTRKGLIPWLLFFGVVFLLFKTLPTAILFYSPHLKQIWNLIDLFGLGLVMFTGILRVIMIPEENSTQLKTQDTRNRILRWYSNIPTYSKILFLLYISFLSFYISSESFAIAVILHIPDYMSNLKLEFLSVSFFIGALYAFFIHRPVPKSSQFFKNVRSRINIQGKRKN